MAVRLDLVGIVVKDMGRSPAFYRQFGLDLPSELDGQPHAETTLRSGLRLAWDTQESLEQSLPDYQVRAPGSGRIGVAFLAASAAEVAAVYDRLTSLGYTGGRAPWDALWGQRYAVVQDPDGHGIEQSSPPGASCGWPGAGALPDPANRHRVAARPARRGRATLSQVTAACGGSPRGTPPRSR